MKEKRIYWLVGIVTAVCMAGVIAFIEILSQPPAARHAVQPSPELLRIQAESRAQAARLAAEKPKAEQAKQARRKALIEKLIREGVFQKVETPGNLPHLWVRPGFYALDFEAKSTFVAVVYAYYFDGSKFTDSVVLYDSSTGKEIGEFNPNLYPNGGLKLE